MTTKQTQKQIDQKWTKDILTSHEIYQSKTWSFCAVGDNLNLPFTSSIIQLHKFLEFLDKKCNVNLLQLGTNFSDSATNHNHTYRKETYKKIKRDVQKIKKKLGLPKDTRIQLIHLKDMITKHLRNNLMHNYKIWGITTMQGYFLREDGRVEVKVYDHDKSNSVTGKYYEHAKIISQKKAWELIFDSPRFKTQLQKNIDAFMT